MDFIKSYNICVNSIMLPGSLSKSTYSIHDYPSDAQRGAKLVFIPTQGYFKFCNLNTPRHIPALLKIVDLNSASVLCVHFHGNGCDVGEVEACGDSESHAFMANYLIVEYPKFGIGKGFPSESVIDSIAKDVYQFVINDLGVPADRIVLIGRSIGTGPVCNLASYMEEIESPAIAVILQSPYTSLRDAAYDLLGCFSFLFLQRWENWKKLCKTENRKNGIGISSGSKRSLSVTLATHENPLLLQQISISSKPLSDEHENYSGKLGEQYSNPSSSCVIKCPVLFIHADNDLIIDPHHSQMMHNLRHASGLPSKFYLQKSTENFKKGHNFFDYNSEVLIPCRDFLNEFVPFSAPYSLDLEKVKMACIVPKEYFSVDIYANNSSVNGMTGDLEEKNQNNNHRYVDKPVNGDKKAPGLFRDEYRASNYCRWLLCPCIFSIEAVISTSLTVFDQIYYSIPNVKPLFQYETKKSRGKDHINGLKIIMACLRLLSIDHLIREEGHDGDSDESDVESDEEVSPVRVRNPMIESEKFSKKEGIEQRLHKGYRRHALERDEVLSPECENVNSPISHNRRERKNRKDFNIQNPIGGNNRPVLSEPNQRNSLR